MATTQATKEAFHFGVAERGKMYCLEGNQKEALRHYREAIQMSVREGSSDVFFQHYTQCVMESLELLGNHDEVISYCEKALDFLYNKNDESDLITKSIAAILEKQAIQHLFKEERDQAVELLKEAQQLVGRGTQPLTADLLNWVQRGYQISNKQIKEAQKRHNYFVVRKGNVRPEIAIDLPDGIGPQI